MQQLKIDLDEIINRAIGEFKTPEFKTVIAKDRCKNFSILTKAPDRESYFWSGLTASYRCERFAGNDSWIVIVDAIKSVLHDRCEVFMFNGMLEFCKWYVEQGK